MSELPPPEAFESVLDLQMPPVVRERRRDIRRMFYAMVLEELDAGRMTRRRRAELSRFGNKLGLDALDVRLLMTGAEYRSGYCPRSGLLPPTEPSATQFLTTIESQPVAMASLIMAGSIWGATMGLIWLMLGK